EVNLEYRFHLASIGGFKIASAVYTDIGNVWNVRKIASASDPDSRFSFKNLGRDIAIGAGTGLRFDLSYFLIRLDFAYKVKDPLRV
ncbi:BamA/TamA family outer membrane protein, partial [Acinetobacter baumannii]